MCNEEKGTSMSNEPKLKNAVLVNEFTEFGVKSFKADFDDLNSSNLPIIPIYIDSFGGDVYSLLAMLDIISTSVKPVATIALGKAMSCGSILLACGSTGLRFVGPHATVMIHDVATISFGKIEELKSDVGEAERLNIKIFELLNEKCGQPKGYFQKFVAEKKHTNWYLESKEVLKHGLADHVGLPVIDSLFNLDIIKQVPVKKASNEKVVLPKKQRAARKPRK
jgi:ATP-dependent Clp endopeptidase proteolytic subunit ClpP